MDRQSVNGEESFYIVVLSTVQWLCLHVLPCGRKENLSFVCCFSLCLSVAPSLPPPKTHTHTFFSYYNKYKVRKIQNTFYIFIIMPINLLSIYQTLSIPVILSPPTCLSLSRVKMFSRLRTLRRYFSIAASSSADWLLCALAASRASISLSSEPGES